MVVDAAPLTLLIRHGLCFCHCSYPVGIASTKKKARANVPGKKGPIY